MGWWYADQATLYFENMPVPAKNLMGEENLVFIAIMENFNLERVAERLLCLGPVNRFS